MGKNRPIGAIIVAKQKTDVSNRVLALIERLALAGALGLLVAGAFGWYLSWRVVTPVLALSRAADEVAGGNYAVEVPERAAGEIGHLADRFGEMAVRLAEAEQRERNFLMSVSHELRTPLTAIRGHVSALREGVVADPERREHSLEIVEAEAQRLGAARRRHPRPREARRAPLHRPARGGEHGAARRARLRDVHRAGAAALDRLPGRGERASR